VAVLLAVASVAAVAAALGPHNGRFYVTWVYSDPQTGEQDRQQLMVDLFMAHTSGWHWSLFVAVLLGAFLASRARRTSHALAAAVPVGLLLAAVDLAVSWLTGGGTRQRLAWANQSGWPSVPADLLADDAFRMVVAAGLATFASAAVAGVGLGTFFAPVLRSPTAEVARVTLLAVAVYGGGHHGSRLARRGPARGIRRCLPRVPQFVGI
jgi:DNA-binding transcriptional LysR family regulator